MALMKNKVPIKVMDGFLSAFADTGENLCLSPNATKEIMETRAMSAAWVRALKPLWIMHHRLRRLASGHFSLKPASYAIYTLASPEDRVCFDVPKPTAVWWNRI
jgi:hypothetical protein